MCRRIWAYREVVATIARLYGGLREKRRLATLAFALIALTVSAGFSLNRAYAAPAPKRNIVNAGGPTATPDLAQTTATPSPQPLPSAPVVRFDKLSHRLVDGSPGYDLHFSYNYDGPDLYIDGIGEVPTAGELGTSTASASLTFRSGPDGPVIRDIDLSKENDANFTALLSLENDPGNAVHIAQAQHLIGEDLSAISSVLPVTREAPDTKRKALAFYTLGAADLTQGHTASAVQDFTTSQEIAASVIGAGKGDASLQDVQTLDALERSRILATTGNIGQVQTLLASNALRPSDLSIAAALQQSRAASSTGTSVIPDPLLGPDETGADVPKETDFRKGELIEWHHSRASLRWTLEPILMSFFDDGDPDQAPCVAQDKQLNCMVSYPRKLGNGHVGWDARICLQACSLHRGQRS